MSSWGYDHGGKQSWGCQDKPGMTVYVETCDQDSVVLTVRQEGAELVPLDDKCHDPQCNDSTWDHECPLPPGVYKVVNGVTHRLEDRAPARLESHEGAIGSIHVPNEIVPSLVWNIIAKSGCSPALVIEHLVEQLREIQEIVVDGLRSELAEGVNQMAQKSLLHKVPGYEQNAPGQEQAGCS